jgi:hypothetical protein
MLISALVFIAKITQEYNILLFKILTWEITNTNLIDELL